MKETNKTGILSAMVNLSKVTNFSLPAIYGTANRMNNMGVALEYFVRDAFCGSFETKDLAKKDKVHSQYLSYIGNTNNPPDFMIKGGDAIEVKKIISSNSGLALNSSYPKNQLFSDNPLITDDCRQCEKWDVKDIVYAVGVVNRNKLTSLWLVYGDCYAAKKAIYENTRNKIVEGIQSIAGIELSKTRELGRVNRVDPLGITYLRIRGMWGIENPMKVFDYLKVKTSTPSIIAVMRKEKYENEPKEYRTLLEKDNCVSDAEIKNPDNPAQFLEAKIVSV